MKKNKKRLLIGTLILFVVWSCVTVFIIFKDNKKAKKYEYTNKFKKDNENNKEDNDYVIKEAELIISDYLKSSENNSKDMQMKNKKLKLINIILGFLLIVSIIF